MRYLCLFGPLFLMACSPNYHAERLAEIIGFQQDIIEEQNNMLRKQDSQLLFMKKEICP